MKVGFISGLNIWSLCILITVSAWAEEKVYVAKHEQGRIIVKFDPKEAGKYFRKDDKDQLARLQGVLSLPAGAELDEMQTVKWVREWKRQKNHKFDEDAVDLSEYFYLKTPPGMTDDELVSLLRGKKMITRAERIAIGSIGMIPNESEFEMYQWYYGTNLPGRVFAPQAWDITTGTSDVIVAVIDTGIDTNVGPAEFAGRITNGWDFVSGGDPDPFDDNALGHGTIVSALIGGTGNNNYQMAGMDWHCKIMPLKACAANGDWNCPTLAQAVNWAVTNGAKIINFSGGVYASPGETDILRDAITNAISNGVIFITITQNYGYSSNTFPGSMPESITVGGIDQWGTNCPWANHGPGIDLVAPATNVWVHSKTGTKSVSGTSFAAPQVSGVASLICSIKPGLDQQQMHDLLAAGADDKVSMDPLDTQGYDLYYGWGKVNAYHSLVLAGMSVTNFAVSGDTNICVQWEGPVDASNARPFVVEYADVLTNLWTNSTNNFVYTTNTVEWTDYNGTAFSNRFYRIKIKSYPQ